MKIMFDSFKCSNAKCLGSLERKVLIAESEIEYERFKKTVPQPFAEWQNGDLTKKEGCAEGCEGTINVVQVRKDF